MVYKQLVVKNHVGLPWHNLVCVFEHGRGSQNVNWNGWNILPVLTDEQIEYIVPDQSGIFSFYSCSHLLFQGYTVLGY